MNVWAKKISGFAALLLLAGCATNVSREPIKLRTPAVAQSVSTAPADLQLLCSAAAAEKFGVARDQIIPTDSIRLNTNDYRVLLESKSVSAECIVNRQAQITQLTEV